MVYEIPCFSLRHYFSYDIRESIIAIFSRPRAYFCGPRGEFSGARKIGKNPYFLAVKKIHDGPEMCTYIRKIWNRPKSVYIETVRSQVRWKYYERSLRHRFMFAVIHMRKSGRALCSHYADLIQCSNVLFFLLKCGNRHFPIWDLPLFLCYFINTFL